MAPLERSPHFRGDLRRLTGIIGAAIAFFGILLLAVIAYAGRSANETATDRERTLVENALNESIARALSEQKSVAWWDDPIIKITDDAIDLTTFRHPLRAAYVLGPEKGSLSPEMLSRCRSVIKIPTRFCLNVAMAAAVVMYDRVRSASPAPRLP